jgi:hypothetical protein
MTKSPATIRSIALSIVLVGAGCGAETPRLGIRLRGPADPGLLAGVTTLVLSVLGEGSRPLVLREFPASTQRLQIDGVPYARGVVFVLAGLAGVDPIVSGRTCPLDVVADRTLPDVSILITRLGSFTPTARPAAAQRDMPFVFARGDGTIIVAGGRDAAGEPLDSVESFDPGTGSWTGEAPLPTPRVRGQVAPLVGGGALLLGGLGPRGEVIETIDAYRPVQGWTSIPATRDVTGVGLVATSLQDGKILVTGGALPGGPARDTATLVEKDGSLHRAGALALARAHHTVSVVGTGGFSVAYVIGGAQGGDLAQVIGDIEVFDPRAPEARSSGQVGSLLTARALHTATVLDSGEVLVVGGQNGDGAALDSAETFDPITRAVAPAGRLEGPRIHHSATLLHDGRVLVTGGIDGTGQPLRSAEIYDPTVRNFVSARPLGIARADHRTIELCDGTVLVVGGGPGAEIYNPARL